MSQNKCRVIASAGLGNQLFQFAFAHHLSTLSNRSIKFENSIITSRDPLRKFELAPLEKVCSHLIFNTNKPINHNSLLGRFLYKTNLSFIVKNLLMKDYKYFDLSESDFKRTTDLSMHNMLMNNGKHINFSGYWQNWQFAYRNRSVLATELLVYLSQNIKTHSKLIGREKPLLVVHVRRGDYNSQRLKEIVGTISLQSYVKKIKELKDLYPNLEVITLTDSSFIQENANLIVFFGTILDVSETTNWEALKIMSCADFLIAANSTFSWWGGFLSSFKGGTVFIPNKWFLSEPSEYVDNFKSPDFLFYDANFSN
jgi:hypothetical protein